MVLVFVFLSLLSQDNNFNYNGILLHQILFYCDYNLKCHHILLVQSKTILEENSAKVTDENVTRLHLIL